MVRPYVYLVPILRRAARSHHDPRIVYKDVDLPLFGQYPRGAVAYRLQAAEVELFDSHGTFVVFVCLLEDILFRLFGLG